MDYYWWQTTIAGHLKDLEGKLDEKMISHLREGFQLGLEAKPYGINLAKPLGDLFYRVAKSGNSKKALATVAKEMAVSSRSTLCTYVRGG